MAQVTVMKKAVWQKIRTHCLECVGGSTQEVMLCTCPDCVFYEVRFGRPGQENDPVYIKCSENQYKVGSEIREWINGQGWVASGKF